MVLKSKQVSEFKETEIGKIPTDWEIEKLEKLLFIKGRIGWKGLKKSEFGKEGIFIINGPEIQNGKVNWTKCLRVPKWRYDESHEISVKEGDILMTKDGTIGKTAYIETLPEPATLASGIFLIRSDSKKLDQRFLYFYFNSEFFNKLVESRIEGSVIPHLYQRDIIQLSIPLPSISEQESIAKIILNIESKIQILQNQNKILEKIAQAIFKSWFVDFDGVTEFEDSELGKIPKGWEIKTIGELVDHQKGFGFKSSDYQMHGKRIIRITNLTKDSIDLQNCVFIDEKKVQEQKHQKVILNENDILITTVGSNLNHPESRVGRPIRVPTFAAGSLLNQNIVNLRCRDNDLQLFLLQNIVHQKFFDYLSARTQGSANQASITLNVIFDYSICLPINDNILKKFCIISNSIYNKINKNQILIQSLVKTHNILLPKLMSGEIRV